MTVLTHPTARRTQSDDELVAGVRAGRPEAFDAIVARYGPALERFARGLMAGAHHDAEEVVQDTLLRALVALRRDRREVLLRPWLHAICRNACLDRLRRPVRTVDMSLLEPVLADHRADPVDAIAGRQELDALIASVQRLPERQRTALVALVVDGERHEDVARELEVSVAASKALVCRARRRLHADRAAAAA